MKTKTCPICNNNFAITRNNRNNKTCSKECGIKLNALNRKHNIKKQCIVCGKDFIVSKSGVNINCCSKKCAYESMKTYQKCEYCEGVFYNKGNNKRRKYCSKECSSKARDSKIEAICDNCGKKFLRAKRELLNRKNVFCSRECANNYQGKNKVSFICAECGNIFKLSKSTVDSREYSIKYCSLSCRNNSWEKEGYGFLLENCRKQQLLKPTKLELYAYNILDSLKVDYIKQYQIKNNFLVDIYIPSKNTIIQLDGDYWHGNPKKFPKLNNQQIKQIKKDKSQDAYLIKCGYTVIRIWESDLYNNERVLIDVI